MEYQYKKIKLNIYSRDEKRKGRRRESAGKEKEVEAGRRLGPEKHNKDRGKQPGHELGDDIPRIEEYGILQKSEAMPREIL